VSLEMTEDRKSSSLKLEISEDKSRYGTSKRGFEGTSNTLDLFDRGEEQEDSRTTNELKSTLYALNLGLLVGK
jgi:hypothetical protein